MATLLRLPNTLLALRTIASSPVALGHACGELYTSIAILVARHLDHEAAHPSDPKVLRDRTTDITELMSAVDVQLLQLRRVDEVTDAFPNDLEVGRNQRRPRRKYRTKYTKMLEKAFKGLVADHLRDVFFSYDVAKTRLFNKGVHAGLDGVLWDQYPCVNVVVEAGDEEWKDWLTRQCAGLVEDGEREASPRRMTGYMEDRNEGLKVWLERQREGLSAAGGRREVASTSQIWAPSQLHVEERGDAKTEKEELTVPARKTLGRRISTVWGKGLQRAEERFNVLTRSISSSN